jgi:hypothetical protein
LPRKVRAYITSPWPHRTFDETIARAERENNVILSGEFSGAKFAFLATERDLGVILEVFSFSGTPDEEAP